MYSIFAISNDDGTETIDKAGTEEEAKLKVSMLKSELKNDTFENKTSLGTIDSFNYDQM